MKSLWTLLALVLVFALSISPAEAKKFGAGKSFGSSHQTAPTQPMTRPDSAAPSQNAATAPAANNTGRKGMLGGLMGGLLAGGLLAALFGGAFEGIQMMDILIIALLAFVIFKLLARRGTAAPRPAYDIPMPREATASSHDAFTGAGNSNSGFTASSIPFNLPPGFDMTAFLTGAREHYRTLQDAWNKNDLSKIQEYVTPELYNLLKAERATLEGDQHTEVLFVDAELVRADYTFAKAEVSIKFSGRFRDTVENIEDPISDIWHLERDLLQSNASWHIAGIES